MSDDNLIFVDDDAADSEAYAVRQMREDAERREALARSKGTLYEHGGAPAKNPCGTCPYRKDIASGVWAAEEYDKLPDFDLPTEHQPTSVFMCHQQDGRLCAGWVGCHDMDESLGLRLAVPFGSITLEARQAALEYESPVPLFASGQEAADHGRRHIDSPDEKARKAVEKVSKRQERVAQQSRAQRKRQESKMRGQRPLGAFVDEIGSFQ